ncbi:YqaJ viral recombinase family protein [Listeria monocytogenes]
MLSAAEREIRKNQIGASEIHKLLNFDTEAAQDLFEQKVGLQDYPELDNDAMTAGNILEEQCLEYYAKSNSVQIIMNERIEHKSIKGLVASLDARDITRGIPVENKAINQTVWDSWIAKRSGNATWGNIKLNIPKHYYCQLQTQINVVGSKYGILNVNTLTDEEQENPISVVITDIHNKQIVIDRNDELINELDLRAKYMLDCIKYKYRPSEQDFLEKYIF